MTRPLSSIPILPETLCLLRPTTLNKSCSHLLFLFHTFHFLYYLQKYTPANVTWEKGGACIIFPIFMVSFGVAVNVFIHFIRSYSILYITLISLGVLFGWGFCFFPGCMYMFCRDIVLKARGYELVERLDSLYFIFVFFSLILSDSKPKKVLMLLIELSSFYFEELQYI